MKSCTTDKCPRDRRMESKDTTKFLIRQIGNLFGAERTKLLEEEEQNCTELKTKARKVFHVVTGSEFNGEYIQRVAPGE